MIEKALQYIFSLAAGISGFVVFVLLAPAVIAIFFFPWGTLYSVVALLICLPFFWVISAHSDFTSDLSTERTNSFTKAFKANPVSSTTFQLFKELNGSEIRELFAIFAEKENYSYPSILEQKVDNLEDDYRNNLRHHFFKLIYDPKYLKWNSRVPGSHHYRSTILDHYANICEYLDRMPIPELLEDHAEYEADLAAKLELNKDAQRFEAMQAREDYLAKRKFFAQLIQEFESSKVTRVEIEKKVMDEFSSKFLEKPQRVFRLNGVWNLHISNQKFSLTASEVHELNKFEN